MQGQRMGMSLALKQKPTIIQLKCSESNSCEECYRKIKLLEEGDVEIYCNSFTLIYY